MPAARTIASRSASGAACGSENSSARARVRQPRRLAGEPQADTSAPDATAAAATVKAWLHRSASASPTVTFTTRLVSCPDPNRLPGMEAVFISLMALVVLLTGYVALVVLYKLFKTQS